MYDLVRMIYCLSSSLTAFAKEILLKVQIPLYAHTKVEVFSSIVHGKSVCDWYLFPLVQRISCHVKWLFSCISNQLIYKICKWKVLEQFNRHTFKYVREMCLTTAMTSNFLSICRYLYVCFVWICFPFILRRRCHHFSALLL